MWPWWTVQALRSLPWSLPGLLISLVSPESASAHFGFVFRFQPENGPQPALGSPRQEMSVLASACRVCSRLLPPALTSSRTAHTPPLSGFQEAGDVTLPPCLPHALSTAAPPGCLQNVTSHSSGQCPFYSQGLAQAGHRCSQAPMLWATQAHSGLSRHSLTTGHSLAMGHALATGHALAWGTLGSARV